MQRKRRHPRTNRRLKLESLESRNLLAGITGASFWQNPDWAVDLDADGSVSPIDAMLAVNAMNDGLAGQLNGRMAPPLLQGRGGPGGFSAANASRFLDSNGDSQLSPVDALLVINCLNGDKSGDPSTEVPTTDSQTDTIGDDAQTLDVTNGLARVRSAINADGDVDVFQLTASENQLNVSLFTGSGGVITVTVVDESGADLAAASTTDGEESDHVALNIAVTTGSRYFLVVSAASGVTGRYSLQVINYTATDLEDDGSGESSVTVDDGTTDDGTTDDGTTDDGTTDDGTTSDCPTPEELFAKVDTNADGAITADEIAAIPNQPLTSDQIEQLVTRLDADASGGISLDEIPMPVLGRLARLVDGDIAPPFGDRPEKPSVDELFANLDLDADGSITADELDALPNVNLTSEQITELVTRFDTDSSGGLTIDEVDPRLLGRLSGLRPGPRGEDRRGFPPFGGKTPEERFAELDADGDGFLSLDEFKAGRPSSTSASSIRIAAVDSVFSGWRPRR